MVCEIHLFNPRMPFQVKERINSTKENFLSPSAPQAWFVDKRKEIMNCAPDWSENAENGQHLWSITSSSSDCYLGETECTRRGVKHKCSSCKIIIHSECIRLIADNKEVCKQTFTDVDVRMYREETTIKHHWVRRKLDRGKCNCCMKSLNSKKLAFGCRELVTVCLWCKTAYHSRESCFNDESNSENCSMGYHSNIIVPPCWILKLPKKGNFKSSIKQSPLEKIEDEKRHEDYKAFVIKPIPVANVHPVIVFINPKSGGNQGVKLLQKFQWLLNPRQVFDLTQGGPGKGLELYKRVPYLRVLACGGDGTVGWVLSVIDKIGFSPPPAVGVLPLGTGNDLARALGWGGGYTDEPISKILANVGKSDVIQLDRWVLTVEKNSDASSDADGVDHLPLNVINNYFSFGADAHIALEFHQAREARPDKFNSRLRNKMFYGQRGGKDLVRRKWKDLAEFVTLHCDEKDYTSVLKEHKFHAIVFLNIPSYGGGTRPWAKSSEQSTEDGLIEVVGLTTFQLPLLQAGSHGSSICQCKSAKIVTSKTIPMQVDGEACKLNPSIITLNLLNKAFMLAKKKRGRNSLKQSNMNNLKVKVNLLSMPDYELYHNDTDHLKNIAIAIGDLEVAPEADLELVRVKTNELISKKFPGTKLSSDWCFIDSCTTERFFRIDRAQENLHFLTDIATDDLYILNSFPEASDIETAYPSPSSNHGSTEIKEDKDDIRLEKSNEVTSDKYNKKSGKFADLERSKYRVANTNVSRVPRQKSSYQLLEAASIGDIRRLKELHAEGCSLLTTDSNGQTALHYAACYDQREIIKYLIVSAPQAILNMVDNNNGQTALHKAVISKHQKICCMLVAAGASLTIRDFSGKSPRDFANDMEIALYLHCQEGFLNNASGCD